MLVHDCIPCQHGQHDGHTEIVSGSIPGLIGSGQECHCRGECVERRQSPSAADGLPSELPEAWPESR